MHTLSHSQKTLPSLMFLIVLWAIVIFLSKTSPFQNNMASFFPNQDTLEMNYLRNHLNGGQQNQNWLMLSVKLTSLAKFEDDNQSLKIDLKQIPNVKTVLDGSEIIQGPLQQTPSPFLYPYRYLLTDFNRNELSTEIAKRWEELQLGLVLDKHWLLSDPSYQWLEYQKAIHPNIKFEKRGSRWFDTSSNQFLLLVEFSGNKTELLNFNALLKQKLGEGNYSLSGYNWVAMQAEKEIKQSVTLTSSLASLMVFIALLLAFKSAKLLLFSSLPLLAAFTVGTLSTITAFGQMQVITLALGAILLGVAIDYPIHILSAYQSRQSNIYGKIWPTVKLGAITSILGFIALYWVDVDGIKQIGVFASSGLLTALIFTASLRPYFAKHFEMRALAQAPNIASTSKHEPIDSQNINLKLLSIFFLAITIGGSIFILKPMNWQDDIASLTPVSQNLIETDRELRNLFKANEIGKKILVSSASMEELLQAEETLLPLLNQLKNQKQISDYRMLAQKLPSLATQRQRQTRLPDEKVIEEQIEKAIKQTRFKTTHFKSFAEALRETKLLPLLDYAQYKASLAGDPQQESLSWFRNRSQYIGIIQLAGVNSDDVIRKSLKPFSQHGITYFNQRQLVADKIQQTRQGIFNIVLIIAGLLFLIVWLKYRNLTVMLNITMPIIAMFSLLYSSLSLLDVQLNIFHLMSFMLVTAIGIDYSLLFFEGAADGEHFDEWKRSVRIAFLTTIGSFGILSLSDIQILNSIGMTVLFGVVWLYTILYVANYKRLDKTT